MSKVWLITGCSSGFGKKIARAAGQSGDTVVATARDVSKLDDLAEEQGIVNKRLDVLADDAEMSATIDDALGAVGRIDVLVNNAGYVLEGAIEGHAEVDHQFATNVYGQLNVVRARRSGTIANLGSIGGWAGAVAVCSEALRAELAPFGVAVTCVEPGYFRTNLLAGAARAAREALRSDAVKAIGHAIERNRRDLEAWADIISKTDCDDVGTS